MPPDLEQPKSSGAPSINLAALDSSSRKQLHRLLYRQECRVWLLALGLSLWSILLLSADSSYPKFREYTAIAVAILLSFWVGYPAQTILVEIRKKADAAEIADNEGRFDSSWQSLWDFGPPVILPALPFIGLLLYRLWSAM